MSTVKTDEFGVTAAKLFQAIRRLVGAEVALKIHGALARQEAEFAEMHRKLHAHLDEQRERLDCLSLAQLPFGVVPMIDDAREGCVTLGDAADMIQALGLHRNAVVVAMQMAAAPRGEHPEVDHLRTGGTVHEVALKILDAGLVKKVSK